MKWIILLVLLFQTGELADYSLLTGDTKEQCEEAKAKIYEAAKARNAEIWAQCVENTHKPKKAPPPPPARGSDS